MAGFSSSKGNLVGRLLGNNYKIADPLIATAERKEKAFLDPKGPDVPQDPGLPTVNQAAIDRQAQDLARRRRGVAANQLAGDVGFGTVATRVLGGG